MKLSPGHTPTGMSIAPHSSSNKKHEHQRTGSPICLWLRLSGGTLHCVGPEWIQPSALSPQLWINHRCVPRINLKTKNIDCYLVYCHLFISLFLFVLLSSLNVHESVHRCRRLLGVVILSAVVARSPVWIAGVWCSIPTEAVWHPF